MALMKSKEIPKDAVLLDEEEATKYVWEMVSDWKSKSDTWALRNGPIVLGCINAFSGVVINQHYRKKMKLGPYGFFASVLPISMMPGLLTTLFHRYFVSTEFLLMKSSCPLCYEVRSAVIQWTFGIAYPMVLGPTAAMMFAHRYSTYRVPDLKEGPKVIYQFLKKMTKPFTGTLVALSVLQILGSSVVTHYEMKNNFTIRRKIEEIERKVDSEFTK